ncbi:MAG: methyltransferase domain-containing protein [Alphaproteobacteria bacterium]|nr:methyltransferase domain-containing protein [Alphaproteobacteria bacterium]
MSVQYEQPDMPARAHSCPLCGFRAAERLADERCPGCGQAARTRSLAPFIEEELSLYMQEPPLAGGNLLAFAMTAAEQKLLAPLFPEIVSVSLFGEYGDGLPHEQGVDMRDLSRFAPASFAAVFSILVFDYFTEMRQAMDEAFRILKPGGILFTMISPDRLTDGFAAPEAVKYIEAQPNYFDYLPAGTKLVSASVGRRWFVRELRRAGFRSRHLSIPDDLTTMVSDWFIGRKPSETGFAARLPLVWKSLTGSRRL